MWKYNASPKELVDAKRGAIFTKLANNISLAPKRRSDPETNASSRAAIEKARQPICWKDIVERAVKKELANWVVLLWKNYIMKRLDLWVRSLLLSVLPTTKIAVLALFVIYSAKNGGSFGAVMWNFEQLGVFLSFQ